MRPPRSSYSDDLDFSSFFIIAFAVFVGVVAALLVVDQIRAYQVEAAMKKVVYEADREFKAMQKAANFERQMQEQAARDQQQAALARSRAQADAEARRLADQREKRLRKEQAWHQFYQPSAECRRDAMTYGCADAHIRAKTAFEAQYRD